MTPVEVIRPIFCPLCSANQRLPSGPAVMVSKSKLVGTGNSVIVPDGVIRPILLVKAFSVNQILPSGPAVMEPGRLFRVGMTNSLIVPVAVIRPILFSQCSVNQRLSSGPSTIEIGPLFGVGVEYSPLRHRGCTA